MSMSYRKSQRSSYRFIIAVLSASLCASLSPGVCAQPSPSLSLTRVATGLSSPVFATAAPGQPDNLYIVERGGHIRILNLTTGVVNPTAFLTSAQLSATTGGLSSGNERGLLGLAFHPNYETNGLFYLNYTNSSGHTRIRRFSRSTSNPLVADTSTFGDILLINQPFSNHNGGWLAFGPDGYLYIGTGDGGSGGDPNGNGQNKNVLLGKMLRIIPSTIGSGYTIPPTNPWVGQAGVREEIWAYGLRNPWRNSFDRLTGDLYIGDVGQSAREEIDFQPASSTGGENYGWVLREGMLGNTIPPANVNPIYNYLRTPSGQPFRGYCVTGGYVYRGPIQGIRGHYFFGDYGSQRLFSLKFDGSSPSSFNGTNYTSLLDWVGTVQLNVGTLGAISSFAEDSYGNLYLINLGGNIYKFTDGFIPAPTEIAGANFYHRNWSGEGSTWNAIDASKVVAQPGDSPVTLGVENMVSSTHGITGLVLDVHGLYSLDDAKVAFTVSPQGPFSESENPISSWENAPEPASVTYHPWAGVNDSNRLLIEWDDDAIANRWLRVQLAIGSFTKEFYLGHLLGEISGPVDSIYTVSFEDVSLIRTAVGQTVDAGSEFDIDKNGTVSFGDISAMRTGIGAQLTNITLP